MNELTFEQTNALEVIEPETVNLDGKKRGGKVVVALLAIATTAGVVALFKKGKQKRAAKRDKNDIDRLTKKGYLITPPMLEVDENCSTED